MSKQLAKKNISEKDEKSAALNEIEIKKPLIIVSGLPRSGTSMMMQVLKAGGITILTDNQRRDDINNPKGYLEFEKVKKLPQDTTWLKEAEGKAVKIVSPLLQYLPDSYNYKIIFMQRELREVLISQQKMLGKDPANYPPHLEDTFKKQLEITNTWLQSKPNMDVLYVHYSDVVEQAQKQMENISAFLDAALDIDLMSNAVDKELYRNKKANK